MKRRTIVIIIFIVFAVAWLLGFLRFENEIALISFKVLMFPFGYIYLLIEQYGMSLKPNHILQNEFMQGGVFCILIMFQAILYAYLLSVFMKKKAAA